jgi:hypothetical protein
VPAIERHRVGVLGVADLKGRHVVSGRCSGWAGSPSVASFWQSVLVEVRQWFDKDSGFIKVDLK